MPSFFKSSSKNKTASAATTPSQTPSQTPRNSFNEQRPGQSKMLTQDEALHLIFKKTMTNPAAGLFIR
ncbi:hypothetical protein EMPS_01103 [Entomortierella parvispora]|uniref:Uncharacterized protein n=1 Tax=Entomortierella parvispora TaxID=205924 RepID=A0A9P3H2C6_9FUNG|nr:hypothetical protein EMPS_01103 [Entomortierella parvispora]